MITYRQLKIREYEEKVIFRIFDFKPWQGLEGLAKPVPKRSEGMKALLRRNPEKPVFCEAKSHPKNKNLKLDICPIIIGGMIKTLPEMASEFLSRSSRCELPY